jgi:hypothetical protein
MTAQARRFYLITVAAIIAGECKFGRASLCSCDSVSVRSRCRVVPAGRLAVRGVVPPKKSAPVTLPDIRSAHGNPDVRSNLPSAIAGIWKADLFLGTRESNRWVAATVKSNPRDVTWHPGLRVAIHPATKGYEELCDEDGLIRIPLPYDFGFMHYFHEAFAIVRSLLKSHDRPPSPHQVIDPAARYIAEKVHRFRKRPVREILEILRELADEGLLAKPRIVVPNRKVIVDLDFITRFLPKHWVQPADQVDASDSPRSIGPLPLLHAA